MSQAAPDIYTECLLPLKHGYPLYRPEPDHGLPRAYRAKGISIGDVGIITPEGYFDFLFNICQDGARTSDANNVNQFGVPDGHEMIAKGEVVEDPNHFGEKAVVANGSDEHASVGARGGTKQIGCWCKIINLLALTDILGASIIPVSVGAGFEFTCSTTRGAILVLPDGATYTAAKSTANFLHSIDNVRAWFKHAEGRGRVSKSLTLVTGHVKSKSWGVAAISNSSKSESVSLNFSLAEAAEGSLSASHSWQGYSPWMCNSGPKVTSPNRKVNQCVFITGMRVTRQHRLSPLRLLSEVKITDLKGGLSSYPRLGGTKYGGSSGLQSSAGRETQPSSTLASGGERFQQTSSTLSAKGSDKEDVLDESADDEFVVEGLSDKQDVSKYITTTEHVETYIFDSLIIL
jgi:hypothetical protein